MAPKKSSTISQYVKLPDGTFLPKGHPEAIAFLEEMAYQQRVRQSGAPVADSEPRSHERDRQSNRDSQTSARAPPDEGHARYQSGHRSSPIESSPQHRSAQASHRRTKPIVDPNSGEGSIQIHSSDENSEEGSNSDPDGTFQRYLARRRAEEQAESNDREHQARRRKLDLLDPSPNQNRNSPRQNKDDEESEPESESDPVAIPFSCPHCRKQLEVGVVLAKAIHDD